MGRTWIDRLDGYRRRSGARGAALLAALALAVWGATGLAQSPNAFGTPSAGRPQPGRPEGGGIFLSSPR